MSKINYVIGDATAPQGKGIKIICHICNNKNKWGAGFVIAISKRWEMPEIHYRMKDDYVLGDVDFIPVEPDTFVANMIAQHSVMSSLKEGDKSPIRYDALKIALQHVNEKAMNINGSLHAPMFGTGLAGGKWSIIEKIINEVITVPITIYVLNEKDLPKISN